VLNSDLFETLERACKLSSTRWLVVLRFTEALVEISLRSEDIDRQVWGRSDDIIQTPHHLIISCICVLFDRDPIVSHGFEDLLHDFL
jgi:hypothetical protein